MKISKTKTPKLVLIAGPCVIESLDNLRGIAIKLQPLANNERLDFYFKASFDKANRTSLESYRGPGLEKGLEMLQAIKDEFGYKILTDVHESYQVSIAVKVADILQIPAFLCRQTDLIVEVSQTNAIINIKKGQFMSPKDMQYSVLKALKTRDKNIQNPTYENALANGVWLCERGSSFGYGNLVVDMRSLKIMREFAPVIFDATHSVQMPGGANGKSSGESSFAPILARAAAAVGVDGLFAETHIDPKNALSDGANMLKPNELESLVTDMLKIQNLF